MPWYELFLFFLFMVAAAALVVGSIALHRVEHHTDDPHPPNDDAPTSQAPVVNDVKTAVGKMVLGRDQVGSIISVRYPKHPFHTSPHLNLQIESDLGAQVFHASRVSGNSQSFVFSVHDEDVPLAGQPIGKAALQNVEHYPALNKQLQGATLVALNDVAGQWNLSFSAVDHADFLDGPFKLAPQYVSALSASVNPVDGARSKLLHIPDLENKGITDAFLFLYIAAGAASVVAVRFRINELRDQDISTTKPNVTIHNMDLSGFGSGVVNITKLDAYLDAQNYLHMAFQDNGGIFNGYVVKVDKPMRTEGHMHGTFTLQTEITSPALVAPVSKANLKLLSWEFKKELRPMLWSQSGGDLSYHVMGDTPNTIYRSVTALTGLLAANGSWDVAPIMDHQGKQRHVIMVTDAATKVTCYLDKEVDTLFNNMPDVWDTDTELDVMTTAVGWNGRLVPRPQLLGAATTGGDCLLLMRDTSGWLRQFVIYVNDQGKLHFQEYDKEAVIINHRQSGQMSNYFEPVVGVDGQPYMAYITSDLRAHYTKSSAQRDFIPQLTASYQATGM